MRRHEQGITFIGVLALLVLAGFIVLLAVKLIPPYINNWQVKEGLASVAEQPDIGSIGRDGLRIQVSREFSIGYVSDVRISRDLSITRAPYGYMLTMNYIVKVPVIANITALIHFVDNQKVLLH